LPADTFSEAVLNRILTSATFEEFGCTRPGGQDGLGQEWLRRRGDSTELEFGPHNRIHVILSGDMVTLMSPLDPIFWLHHCNIDRVWTLWAASHPNVIMDPLHLGMSFEGQFTFPAGAPAPLSVEGVLDTEKLGYRYDAIPAVNEPSSPALTERIELWQRLPKDVVAGFSAKFQNIENLPQVPEGGSQILIASSDKGGTVDKTAPLTIPLTAPAKIQDLIGDVGLFQSGSPDNSSRVESRRVFTTINSILPPSDLSTSVRIFVNCDYLSPETNTDDPHYVTTVSFFGVDHHASHNGVSISVDLTSALGTARRNGSLGSDQLLVQFMPVGSAEPEATAIKIGRVDAAIL
jgi:tyrosinase